MVLVRGLAASADTIHMNTFNFKSKWKGIKASIFNGSTNASSIEECYVLTDLRKILLKTNRLISIDEGYLLCRVSNQLKFFNNRRLNPGFLPEINPECMGVNPQWIDDAYTTLLINEVSQ
eukprot:scaffold2143_cov79-Skeletonema_dohrnii-CCMP3373.AAC.2